MIKIIKDGRKEFVGNCDMCGCEFSYDISDVAFTSVPCPCCGHHYVHKNLNSIPISVTPGELQK